MNNSPGSDKNEVAVSRLSPTLANVVARGFSLLAGIGVAVIFYYLLYRIGFPSKPFIYVAF